jgi:hypothetical protein
MMQPRVGMRVKLNSYGYARLHLKSELAMEQARNMLITRVENIGYDDAPIWAIRVDASELDKYMMESEMVTEITGATK